MNLGTLQNYYSISSLNPRSRSIKEKASILDKRLLFLGQGTRYPEVEENGLFPLKVLGENLLYLSECLHIGIILNENKNIYLFLKRKMYI